jgi:D-alanyl-D-alanine carboxypeptidase (penicillin-binding protein 5/6)
MVLSRAVKVPYSPRAIAWPTEGQGAVAVPALGSVLASGAEQPVPVASLTKIMTAYVVLRDHPLSPDASGPVLTVAASDVSEAVEQEEANDTMVPVQAGEVLSERQLLDGLLVHSANNFANLLARWDAGSIARFVSKMNAVAGSLGMTDTHYADADGIDPQSTSTAADQLRVASAAMKLGTFAAIVAQPTVTLPIAGQVGNIVTQIGSDGIVGVKSGFTQAAMGCLVLAARRSVDGHEVLVIAAVTDQTGLDPLDAAAKAALSLIDATAASLRDVTVVATSRRVATVTTSWSSTPVAGMATRPLYAVVWPGETVRRSIRWTRVRAGATAGTKLGTMEVTVGAERLSVPVVSASAIREPSTAWRLEHP